MKFEELDGSKFINLKELAELAFPPDDDKIVEITAERKTSKHFRAICDKYNIDREKYKPNKSRSYKIPLHEKNRWILGVRHIEFSLGLELNREKTILLVEDVIDMKYDLEESLMVNINRDFTELKNQDHYKISQIYYGGGDISREITKYHFFMLEDQIQEDLEYILTNAKKESMAEHAENYINEVIQQFEFVGKTTRQLIGEENNKEME